MQFWQMIYFWEKSNVNISPTTTCTLTDREKTGNLPKTIKVFLLEKHKGFRGFEN